MLMRAPTAFLMTVLRTTLNIWLHLAVFLICSLSFSGVAYLIIGTSCLYNLDWCLDVFFFIWILVVATVAL